MPKQISAEMISAYLDGELSSEDTLAVRKWLEIAGAQGRPADAQAGNSATDSANRADTDSQTAAEIAETLAGFRQLQSRLRELPAFQLPNDFAEKVLEQLPATAAGPDRDENTAQPLVKPVKQAASLGESASPRRSNWTRWSLLVAALSASVFLALFLPQVLSSPQSWLSLSSPSGRVAHNNESTSSELDAAEPASAESAVAGVTESRSTGPLAKDSAGGMTFESDETADVIQSQKLGGVGFGQGFGGGGFGAGGGGGGFGQDSSGKLGADPGPANLLEKQSLTDDKEVQRIDPETLSKFDSLNDSTLGQPTELPAEQFESWQRKSLQVVQVQLNPDDFDNHRFERTLLTNNIRLAPVGGSVSTQPNTIESDRFRESGGRGSQNVQESHQLGHPSAPVDSDAKFSESGTDSGPAAVSPNPSSRVRMYFVDATEQELSNVLAELSDAPMQSVQVPTAGLAPTAAAPELAGQPSAGDMDNGDDVSRINSEEFPLADVQRQIRRRQEGNPPVTGDSSSRDLSPPPVTENNNPPEPGGGGPDSVQQNTAQQEEQSQENRQSENSPPSYASNAIQLLGQPLVQAGGGRRGDSTTESEDSGPEDGDSDGDVSSMGRSGNQTDRVQSDLEESRYIETPGELGESVAGSELLKRANLPRDWNLQEINRLQVRFGLDPFAQRRRQLLVLIEALDPAPAGSAPPATAEPAEPASDPPAPPASKGGGQP